MLKKQYFHNKENDNILKCKPTKDGIEFSIDGKSVFIEAERLVELNYMISDVMIETYKKMKNENT